MEDRVDRPAPVEDRVDRPAPAEDRIDRPAPVEALVEPNARMCEEVTEGGDEGRVSSGVEVIGALVPPSEDDLLEFLVSFPRARVIQDQLHIVGRESFYIKYPFLLRYTDDRATAAAIADGLQELQSVGIRRVVLKRLLTENVAWTALALQQLMGQRPTTVLPDNYCTRLHNEEEPGGVSCDVSLHWPPVPPPKDSVVRMERRGLLFNTINVSVVGDEVIFAGLECFFAKYPFMRNYKTVPVPVEVRLRSVEQLNAAGISRVAIRPRAGDDAVGCTDLLLYLTGSRTPVAHFSGGGGAVSF